MAKIDMSCCIVVYQVSDEGRGVASIAQMLTLSRINTAIGSTSAMRRIINLARDYSTKREVFGKLIHKNPLHMQTLARMEVLNCFMIEVI